MVRKSINRKTIFMLVVNSLQIFDNTIDKPKYGLSSSLSQIESQPLWPCIDNIHSILTRSAPKLWSFEPHNRNILLQSIFNQTNIKIVSTFRRPQKRTNFEIQISNHPFPFKWIICYISQNSTWLLKSWTKMFQLSNVAISSIVKITVKIVKNCSFTYSLVFSTISWHKTFGFAISIPEFWFICIFGGNF